MMQKKFIACLVILFVVFFPFKLLSLENRGVEVKQIDGNEQSAYGDYYALIIGINGYTACNPLKTAVKDAKVIKDILTKKYGFEEKNVVLRVDAAATRERIIRDLRTLASGLGEKDNLLIYFAGHGQLDDLTGDGYWIPVEGEPKNPSNWISHSTIKNILCSERVIGKNIILVVDSCYSGSLLRGGPSLISLNDKNYKKKLAKLSLLRSRQVITSGGLEPVADGGRDGHSLFGYYFVKALAENDKEIIDLENLFYSRIWKPVAEIGDQRPSVGRLKTPMDEDGQFVLMNTIKLLQEEQSRRENQQRLEARDSILKEKKRIEEERRKLAADLERFEVIEKEQKRLAEEQRRIEAERKLAAELERSKIIEEEQKKLAEERRRIEAERKLFEENKKKFELAYIPKTQKAFSPEFTLRSKGQLNPPGRSMIKKYNFYDSQLNRDGDFKNVFVDNGNDTITDRTTGLMWQKGGSDNISIIYGNRMTAYVESLNTKRFCGYSDWRLPTTAELASLLESSTTKSQLHINALFSEVKRCGSSDTFSDYAAEFNCYVDFGKGCIVTKGKYYGMLGVRAHVKAVRSIK